MLGPWTRAGASLVALGMLGACTENGTTFITRTNSDTFTQEPTDKIDILWVIDNSHSMREEQEALASEFGGFIASIEETNTDFHLGVITTSFDSDDPDRGRLLAGVGTDGEALPAVITDEDDYVALFQDRIRVGTDGSDKEKGLAAAEYALSAVMTSGANAGFLRSDAFLLVLFVTDENDCSDNGVLDAQGAAACYEDNELLVPVSNYAYTMQDLKPPGMLFTGGIIGPRMDNSAGCVSGVVPGVRYREFLSMTGGTEGSICDGFSSLMFDMGLQASGVRSSFVLSDTAREESLIVWIDEVEVPADPDNGWTYHAEGNYVAFHGDAIPPRGSEILIEYELSAGS